MKVSQHVVLSTVVAALTWSVSRSAKLAAASLLSGVLIDTDHLVDYLREHGLDINKERFFRSFEQDQFRKMLIPLHAWEWIFVLIVVAFMTKWNRLLTGITIGMLHHMVADQLTNKPYPLGYSLLYRAYTGFAYGRSFIRKSWGPIGDRQTR